MAVFTFQAHQVTQVLRDLDSADARSSSSDDGRDRGTSLLLVISRGIFITSDAAVNGRIMARRAYAIGCDPDANPRWRDNLQFIPPGLEIISHEWARSLIEREDETLHIELTAQTLRLLS